MQNKWEGKKTWGLQLLSISMAWTNLLVMTQLINLKLTYGVEWMTSSE